MPHPVSGERTALFFDSHCRISSQVLCGRNICIIDSSIWNRSILGSDVFECIIYRLKSEPREFFFGISGRHFLYKFEM